MPNSDDDDDDDDDFQILDVFGDDEPEALEANAGRRSESEAQKYRSFGKLLDQSYTSKVPLVPPFRSDEDIPRKKLGAEV